MSLDAAEVSEVSLEDILFNDVQEYLAAEAVIVGTITDLTSKIQRGRKSVAIPRTSGLAALDVKQDGTDQVSSNMGITTDVMLLDKFKEVPEYIFEQADIESMVDLKRAYLDAAPKVMADEIERDLYAELKLASAAAPDHILQFSEATNTRPSLADIQAAQQLLDEANVPKTDRWLVMSPAIKVHLLAKQEIQDASRSGSNDALVNGEFARLFGFRMIDTTNADADEMIAYHRSALAYGLQKQIEFIEEKVRRQGREFISIRGKYGTKHLDAGKRAVLFNSTGA